MVKQFPLEFHLNGASILWIYLCIIWTLVLSCTLCMGSEFDVPTFWTWILAGVHRDYPLVTLESSHCPICAPLCSFHCSWPYSRHCKIFVRRSSHNVGILMLLLVVTVILNHPISTVIPACPSALRLRAGLSVEALVERS